MIEEGRVDSSGHEQSEELSLWEEQVQVDFLQSESNVLQLPIQRVVRALLNVCGKLQYDSSD